VLAPGWARLRRVPSLRSRSVGPRRTDIHVLTALSPHPCGSAHCARPAFSLHPSRDRRCLGSTWLKIKIKSFPAEAGPTVGSPPLFLIVPPLRVGMHAVTLRVRSLRLRGFYPHHPVLSPGIIAGICRTVLARDPGVGERRGSAVVLTQQPFHSRIKPAFDLVLDVRGKVVDHVLHDQLRGGTQFGVQVQ
jgi:hypothetical protein